MVIGSWKVAEDKIQEIFNDINIRAKIRCKLLSKSEADRLKYFVGGKDEIKATLEAFLALGKIFAIII